MYEDNALHIDRMKKKEDTAMQTGNLLEKTTPNCRFMTWLWHHHWRNHYSYDVIRVTRSSTNLYLYYFIIKCNLFIKILQRGKNTENKKFVQNYKFPKIFRSFQQNSHCQTSESCRTLKISQSISNRYKLKVAKTQPQQFILSEIFQKVWVGGTIFLNMRQLLSFDSLKSSDHVNPYKITQLG